MAAVLAFGKQQLQVHGQLKYAYSKAGNNGKTYHNARVMLLGESCDVHFKSCTAELVDALKQYEGHNVILIGDAVVEQGRDGGRASLQIGGEIAAYYFDQSGKPQLIPMQTSSQQRRAA